MGLALTIGLLAFLALGLAYAGRSVVDQWARRSVRDVRREFRSRIDRFKLARKADVREALLADREVGEAVRAHAAQSGKTEERAWARVRAYLDEIIPSFSLLSYYKLGYGLSRLLIPLFYKVSVGYEAREALNAIPRSSVVVYLMNHRSNADYVVVAFVLSGEVAISYAVGEWARVWPLETVFKSFGSYFVRRRYREALYHKVLERYVQLITRKGVTQGVFLEGGLTRREQITEVVSYVLKVSVRFLLRRARRYGRACVNFGAPLSVDAWLAARPGVLALPREERLPRIKELADEVMARIAAIMPVTAVSLAAAALLRLPGDRLSRPGWEALMDELRSVLRGRGARLIGEDRSSAEILERALVILTLRRVVGPA